MISGEQIELVLAVIEAGSFSATARRLRRTPSAISMAIGNLEADLGFALFDRSRREPVPTPELLALLPEARLIAERLTALRLHIEQLGEGLEAELTLGLTSELNLRPVLRAIDTLADAYPGLRLNLMTAPQNEILHALGTGQIDACVAYGDPEVAMNETFTALWTETVIAVVAPSHPLAQQRHLSLEDLHAHRQIIVASAAQPLDDRRTMIAAHLWKVGHLELLRELVEAGHGWANMPVAIIAKALDQRRLIALRFSNTRNGLDLPVLFRMRSGKKLGRAAGLLLAELRAGS